MVHVEVDVSHRGPRSTISFPLVGYDGSVPPYVGVFDFHGEGRSDRLSPGRWRGSRNRCLVVLISRSNCSMYPHTSLFNFNDITGSIDLRASAKKAR